MTVIVGLVDADGNIHMGGDSAGTKDNGDQNALDNRKVFFPVHGPWFILGFAGSFRLGQILRYSFFPPLPPPDGVDLQHYMSIAFVDALRKCLKQDGFGMTEHGQETVGGGVLMVGYQGHIYRIEDDFQVLVDKTSYSVMGSGDSVALGAMFATEGRDAEDRIRLALAAATQYNAWCRSPFHVEKLPFDKNWNKKIRKKLAKPTKRKKKK